MAGKHENQLEMNQMDSLLFKIFVGKAPVARVRTTGAIGTNLLFMVSNNY